MTFFKSSLSHFSHRHTPVIANNMSLASWCYQSSSQNAQFVSKVEMCTALCTGQDAWNFPLDRNHHHTLLRVFLEPTQSDSSVSEDTLLIERVLSNGGAYHSIAPIAETFSTGGEFLHPDVHDRICVITSGSSTVVARDLAVERTLTFGDQVRLTLAQLSQILAFVRRTTKLVCDGGDCKFQARSFVFTCMTALAPTLPPRQIGKGVVLNVGTIGSQPIDDSVFELTAAAFLGQTSWLVNDPASMHALKLIEVLKGRPRESATARLYH